jgi:hypothetical protein
MLYYVVNIMINQKKIIYRGKNRKNSKKERNWREMGVDGTYCAGHIVGEEELVQGKGREGIEHSCKAKMNQTGRV